MDFKGITLINQTISFTKKHLRSETNYQDKLQICRRFTVLRKLKHLLGMDIFYRYGY